MTTENKDSKKKPGRTRYVLSFDYAMRRLLRKRVNFGILNGFLSELIGRPITVLEILKILESESEKEIPNLKITRVNFLVKNEKEELMIIEVQYQFEIDYLVRNVYEVSSNPVNPIYKDNLYKDVKKIYSISIIYFKGLNGGSEYIFHGKTDFRGMHTNELLKLNEKQQLLFGKVEDDDLYPEYYLIDVTNFDDVVKNTLDEWVYYLKNNRVEDSFTAQGMKRLRKVLEYNTLPDEEKRAYDKEIDRKLGWDSAIWSAKDMGRTEGEAEDFQKGKQIGIQIGRAKGKQIGLQKAKAEIAKNMKVAGMPIAQISAFTGFSSEEIEQL